MSKIEKLYRQLDELEDSFRAELIEELRRCADGRNDLLFLSREFWPDGYPLSLSSEKADGLIQQAFKIRQLKQKLKEPFRQTLAARYCECCHLWADHSDPHRGSAQSIARSLLDESAGEGSGD